jgi:trans-aconitate methyltransferase
LKTLAEIYSKFKGPGGSGDKGTIHTYIDYYQSLFNPLRHKPIKLLEIGIHTGHSLALWKTYFDKAEITGIDIRKDRINKSLVRGCKVIISDATIQNNLGPFDIIIDDGSHRIEDQIKTFNIFFEKLNTNGLYIIEDIQDIDKNKDLLTSLHYSATVVDLRKENARYDNVLVVYKK